MRHCVVVCRCTCVGVERVIYCTVCRCTLAGAWCDISRTACRFIHIGVYRVYNRLVMQRAIISSPPAASRAATTYRPPNGHDVKIGGHIRRQAAPSPSVPSH